MDLDLDLDPELVALVTTAMAAVGEQPDWPDSSPRDGESRQAWAERTARLRDRHDALALEATRRFGTFVTDPVAVASVSYVDIPVDGGAVNAKVYLPDAEGPRAGVVLLHGGAFWMGGGVTAFELNDDLCRRISSAADAVVVNVDYRLAPEHPFPEQPDDAWRSFLWFHDHAGDFGVDPDRIGVLGISSGGNLAAGIALKARDLGGPHLAGQFLMGPALDLSMEADPDAIDKGLVEAMAKILELYAGDADRSDTALSPLLADLAGVAPAVVLTAEFDPLRDSGRAYVDKVASAGVEAVNLDYPMLHTIATPAVREQATAEFVSEIARVLKR